MPRDWGAAVVDLSQVQKLVHLAMRLDTVSEDAIKTQLVRMARSAYEDELTIQAGGVGCLRRRGWLRNGQILKRLSDDAAKDAASIANTYNYDLALAIQSIAAEVPTANRHVYARRLGQWEAQRAQWKNAQIEQFTGGKARSEAQADFAENNRIEGYAVLMPKTAVCPICQGWIKRGRVPLKVAQSEPPPYHVNCPHIWHTTYDKATEDECAVLWMGE